MKKATKVLALVIALCMMLSLTALADSFEVTVNVDGTDLVVAGDLNKNGSISLAAAEENESSDTQNILFTFDNCTVNNCKAIDNTASQEPSAPKGMRAVLKGNSVWNVPEICYLTVLEVEEGSTVKGVVTVDGIEVDVNAGGQWTGDIVVEPAVEIVNIEGEGYISLDDFMMIFE